MINEIKKAILSGILISIGGCVYMASVTAGLKWFGALLFCGGLFAICIYGFNLYTGKVGYLAYDFKDKKAWELVIITCFFNQLTTFLTVYFRHFLRNFNVSFGRHLEKRS